MAALKQDYRIAESTVRQRAMLDYAAKLTRDPGAMTAADMLPLRAAGLSDSVIGGCSDLAIEHGLGDTVAFKDRLIQRNTEPRPLRHSGIAIDGATRGRHQRRVEWVTSVRAFNEVGRRLIGNQVQRCRRENSCAIAMGCTPNALHLSLLG